MNCNDKSNNLIELLQKEIKQLESKIKHHGYFLIKNNVYTGLKIAKYSPIFIIPIILGTSLVVKIGYFFGLGGPFVIDYIKQKENILEEYNSQKKYRIERHYEQLDYKNELLVCSKWSLQENGIYTRNVDRYDFEKYTKEDVVNAVNSGDLSKIKDVIGEPHSYTEEKTNISKEELNNNYLQLTLYSVNDKEFKYVKETVNENIGNTFAELFFIIVVNLLLTYISCSKFDIDNIVNKIIEESKIQEEDISVLRKKLQIKRDNLNRLL